MENRAKAPARVLATIALAAAALVLVVTVATSLDGDSGDSGGNTPAGEVTAKRPGGEEVAAAYVVQNGDTLTSIAHKTGVPVARILELNPGVDPQILISGEKLKLR
jgi:LysM repeat protein